MPTNAGGAIVEGRDRHRMPTLVRRHLRPLRWSAELPMDRSSHWAGLVYSCQKRRCATVTVAYLDEYVERIVTEWLGRVDARVEPWASAEREAAMASQQAHRLRAELEDHRRLVERGDLSPVEYVEMRRGLVPQIEYAEARAEKLSLPAVVSGRIGRHAVGAWAGLDGDIAAKRDIIRSIASIRLLRAKPGRGSLGPHRVDITWLVGDAGSAAAGVIVVPGVGPYD